MSKAKDKKRRNRKKLNLKQRLLAFKNLVRDRYGLTATIAVSVTFSLVIGGIFLGVYASITIFEQKQRDTWAIMFLELERKADQLTRKIASFQSRQLDEDAEIYRFIPDTSDLENIRGSSVGNLTLEDFGLPKAALPTKWTLLQRAGETYYSKIMNGRAAGKILKKKLQPGDYLVMWPIPFDDWMGNNLPETNKVYALTREGKLLFSNKVYIRPDTVVGRQLVQKFIRNPVAQGQFEYVDSREQETYGFVQELPYTNVVIFSETSVSAALGSIKKIVGRFGFILGGSIFVSLLVIYIPISKVVKTVQSLTRQALQVASGEFTGTELKIGFGELGILTDAFNKMRKSLVQRDKAISELIEEQKHKVRLEGELEIAQTIQRNLLSDEPVPEDAKVTLSTMYIPAEECAGDWYTYYWDEKSNEMIMIIADVSGHGTGSSMFTAIIAGITEQHRYKDGPLNIDEYVMDLNRVIKRLGHGEWHATMLVARFVPGSGQLELVNCGQSFPVIVYPEGSANKSSTVRLPSMVLGVEDEMNTSRKIIPFEPGTQMLMYTDGLEEARGGPNNKQFGRKRIFKTCLSSADSPKQQIGVIHSEWASHLGSNVADDDMCLVSVRAA